MDSEILKIINEAEENKQELSFTKDVHDAYDKAKKYTKTKVEKLLKDLDTVDAADLYNIVQEFLSDIYHNIRPYVDIISGYYKRAKNDLQEHPDEVDMIEEWYGRHIKNAINDLIEKLDK